MYTVVTSTKGIKKQIKAYQRRRSVARDKVLNLQVARVADEIMRTAPRDTNRYVRGYAQAFNQAGVGPLPVPAINPSSHANRIRQRLSRQYRWAARRLAMWYGVVPGSTVVTAPGRTKDKWYRKLIKQRDKAWDQIQKFTETSILIGGRKTQYDLVHGNITNLSLSSLATVRDKIYGGEGRRINLGGRTVIVVKNLEPHTNFVERRSRIMRKALDKARGTGLRRISNKYTKELMRAKKSA